MGLKSLIALLINLVAGAALGVHLRGLLQVLGKSFQASPGGGLVILGALMVGAAVGAYLIAESACAAEKSLGLFSRYQLISAVFAILAVSFGVYLPDAIEADESGQIFFAIVSMALGLIVLGSAAASQVAMLEFIRRRLGLMDGLSLVICSLLVGLAAGSQLSAGAMSAVFVVVLLASAAGLLSHFWEREGIQPQWGGEDVLGWRRQGVLITAVAAVLGSLLLLAQLFIMASSVLQSGEEEPNTAAAALLFSVGISCLGSTVIIKLARPLKLAVGFLLLTGGALAVMTVLIFGRVALGDEFIGVLSDASVTGARRWFQHIGISLSLLFLPSLALGLTIPLLGSLVFERSSSLPVATGGLLAAIGLGAAIGLAAAFPLEKIGGVYAGIAVGAFVLSCIAAWVIEDKRAYGAGVVFLLLFAFFEPPEKLLNRLQKSTTSASRNNGRGKGDAVSSKYGSGSKPSTTVTSVSPDRWKEYMKLGEAAFVTGQYPKALKAYRLAQSLAPKRREPTFSIAVVFTQLGRYEDALDTYKDLLAGDPNDAEVLVNTGYVLSSLKRFKEAETSLRRAVTLKPDHAMAHYNLATIFRNMNRYEDAIEEYDAAIQANPDYSEAIFDYAVMLYQGEEYYPALGLFQKYVRLKPRTHQSMAARRKIRELARKKWK